MDQGARTQVHLPRSSARVEYDLLAQSQAGLQRPSARDIVDQGAQTRAIAHGKKVLDYWDIDPLLSTFLNLDQAQYPHDHPFLLSLHWYEKPFFIIFF